MANNIDFIYSKVLDRYIEIEYGTKLRSLRFVMLPETSVKPIVAIKTGRSKRGAKAVFSHTGSIAGSDEVYSAAFKQAGILRVDTIDELFDAALAFSCQPLSQGKNKKVIPEFASVSNPIDTAGTVSFKIYNDSIKALNDDPNVDAIIVIYVHTMISNAMPPAEAVVEMKQICDKETGKKPIIACWMGGVGTEEGVDILKSGCIPNYPVPERAVKALSALIRHREFLETVNKGNAQAGKCL